MYFISFYLAILRFTRFQPSLDFATFHQQFLIVNIPR
jgi:hypothetical protein